MSHFQSEGFRENNFYNRNSFISTARVERKTMVAEFTSIAVDVKGGIPSSIGETLFNSNPKAAAPNWKAIGGFKQYIKRSYRNNFTE